MVKSNSKKTIKASFVNSHIHKRGGHVPCFIENTVLKLPRNNSLDFETERVHILNYLSRYRDSRKTEELPTWAYLASALYRQYTLEARAPLKKWYQDLYYQKIVDLYGLSVDKNNELNEFNCSLKSKNLQLKSGNQNLPSNLAIVFEKMKHTIKPITDPKLAKYYNDFFETVSIHFIESNCLTQNDLGLEHISKFHTVNDLVTVKSYFKNTAGLYSKLCLYVIDNPFPMGTMGFKIEHHLMPKFLAHDPDYAFTEKQLNKPYNIVSISWLIHFLMHLTRLVEYGQPQDEQALKIITKQKSPGGKSNNKKNFMFASWNPFKTFTQKVFEIFKTDIINNYLEFEKREIEFLNRRARSSAQKRMSYDIKRVLTTNTRWCYQNKYGQKFELAYEAQNPENCSLKDLTLVLIESAKNFESSLNQPISQRSYKKISEKLGKYLKGQGKSIANFHLIDPLPPVQPYTKKTISKRKL